MLWEILAASCLLVSTVLPSPLRRWDCGLITIFDPPSDYRDQRTLYGRSLQLSQSGDLLVTFEDYTPNNFTHFPIYRSTDDGCSWKLFSKVTDQHNGWGLRYQPFLYELPCSFGGFDKGTVFLAGNSIPSDLSQTQIDLYASTDQGATWEFVSVIASGGVAEPINGDTPVWEPFLMLYQDQMICFYSDQRDPSYGQKLVHQTSYDLKSWGPVVDDVTYSNYTYRPGMTTVSELPNGQYFMTYEFYGAVEVAFAAYHKTSWSPLTFNEIEGAPVISSDGYVPSSSPYNTWTPYGGNGNGTLLVNDASSSSVFANYDLGFGLWQEIDTSSPASYSRSLRALQQDCSKILIVGGGPITGNGSQNSVTSDILQL